MLYILQFPYLKIVITDVWSCKRAEIPHRFTPVFYLKDENNHATRRFNLKTANTGLAERNGRRSH